MILLTGSMCIPVYAAEYWPEGPEVVSPNVIVMEASTGTVLYDRDSLEAHYPASITKILTALIVIENCGLDETVTFSNTAVNSLEPNSSILGARAGDTLSVRDCLYALLLQSANEVANALAEHCAIVSCRLHHAEHEDAMQRNQQRLFSWREETPLPGLYLHLS